MNQRIAWAKVSLGVLYAVLLLSPVASMAQKNMNPDSLFRAARDVSFQQENYQRGRELCQLALEIAPQYHDIRVFLGRLYAWDGYYDQAQEELLRVLDQAPQRHDAREALADVYLWSQQYTYTLDVVNTGLNSSPNHKEYLYKKALALKNLEKNREAIIVLDRLLQVDPSHELGRELYENLAHATSLNFAGIRYRNERLGNTGSEWQPIPDSITTQAWHYLTAEFGRRTSLGTVVGRWNLMRRYGATGWQVGGDVYPSLGEGMYGYVNLGISNGVNFPSIRLGGELFKSMNWSLEGSVGIRVLKFQEKTVMVVTGSLGHYYGSYWFNTRTYLSPQDVSFSRSWTGTIRRYFGEADNYLNILMAIGEVPDRTIGAQELLYRNSRRLELTGQWKLGAFSLVTGGVTLANEELFDKVYRGQFGLELGLIRRF